MIDKAQLKMDTGIKVIEEITPVFKDCIFIFVLSQLVVDVIEADALRIHFSLYPADSISSHFLISDRLLNRQFFLPAFFLLLFLFLFLFSVYFFVSGYRKTERRKNGCEKRKIRKLSQIPDTKK